MEFKPHPLPPAPHYSRKDPTSELSASNRQSFSAALFDFDGTLVDSEGPSAVAFASVVNSLGATVGDQEAVEICYGRSWHDAFADAAKIYPVLEGKLDDFIATIHEAIEQAGGFLGEPIPSSLSTLRQIAERMPVAVVSGSFRANLITSLEQMGVAEHVTTVVGAEEYGAGKPSAEPFLVAAKRLGLAPQECVVFEDSDAGIQAARAAGMRCIALRPEAPANNACISVKRLDASDVWQFLSAPASVQAT